MILTRKRSQPQEKFKRNEELIKDYRKGMLIVKMVAKYRISSSRIYELIHNWERKHPEEESIKRI